MSLEVTQSISISGKTTTDDTNFGTMSSSIAKGQGLNINIYLNAPDTFGNNSDAIKADVVSFVNKVFGKIPGVVGTTPQQSTSKPVEEDTSKVDTSGAKSK